MTTQNGRNRRHGRWYLGISLVLVARIGTMFVDLRKTNDSRQLDNFTSEDLLHPRGVSFITVNEDNSKWRALKQREPAEAKPNFQSDDGRNKLEAEEQDLNVKKDKQAESQSNGRNEEQRDPVLSKNGDMAAKGSSEHGDAEKAKNAATSLGGEHGDSIKRKSAGSEENSNPEKRGEATKRENDDPTNLAKNADTTTNYSGTMDRKKKGSEDTKPERKGDSTTQTKGNDDVSTQEKQVKQALKSNENEVKPQIRNPPEAKGEPNSDGNKEAQWANMKEGNNSNKHRGIVQETEASDVRDDLKTNTLEGEASLVCSPWEVNIDDFWQNHPDWEPSLENVTHTCFSPIKDPEKVVFLQKLHKQQFPDNPKEACSNVAVSWFQNFGFGSQYMIIYPNDFFAYYHLGRPFTITNPNARFQFAYVPSLQEKPAENSWAACPSQDAFCYFLPISSCEAPPGTPHAPTNRQRPKKKLRIMWDNKNPESAVLKQQHQWMSEYLMRPRQETRRHLYELVQNEAPQLPSAPDCTWIHVRRGDAQTELEWGFFRNFYPIELYLKKGKIKPQDGDVLILTDDEAAIEEALLLHPEYQWKFFNKTRNRGVQKMFAHFPTKDPALEMLTILAEMKVASQCKRGVFGESKFPKLIEMAMSKNHRQDDMTKIKMDGGIRRKTEDAHKFMEELEAKLVRARNAKMQKQSK